MGSPIKVMVMVRSHKKNEPLSPLFARAKRAQNSCIITFVELPNFNLLCMQLDSYKIILASQSPRRQQLLREAGFTNFVVKPMNVDETPPPQYPAEKLAIYLANIKAEAARPLLGIEGDIILASDTTVVLNGKLYEKPLNFDDARRILRDLSGNMHKVITGVCILSKNKKKVFSDIAKVYFDRLSDSEIDFYLNTYKPFDKAGAYGVQEWLGHCKIRKIVGSYSTIMGLPTYRVFNEILKFDV